MGLQRRFDTRRDQSGRYASEMSSPIAAPERLTVESPFGAWAFVDKTDTPSNTSGPAPHSLPQSGDLSQGI